FFHILSFLLTLLTHPSPTHFPYTTLFRSAAAEGVASLIKGTIALPHAYGRLQFGEDLELTFRTLAGVGRNPNIAAAVVIGIEPKDRKSTRLNSSHQIISYAVFCLKKKNFY